MITRSMAGAMPQKRAEAKRHDCGVRQAPVTPAHDPPGFDRVAYQAELATELTAFLAAALAA